MDDEAKYVVDRRPPRVDWERMRQGPTAADLEAMPATTAEDWKDGVILSPLPKDIARELGRREAVRKSL